MSITRRQFTAKSLSSVFLMSLSKTLVANDFLSSQLSMKLDDWMEAIHRASEKLLAQESNGGDWQKIIDNLYANIPLNELLEYIDYDKIKSQMDYSRKGECFIRCQMNFPGEDMSSEYRQIVTKIAGVQPGFAVPPHGHENMVSAFYVLEGGFHVRQFDRLHETSGHVYVRETRNENQKMGEWSGISDEKDNCHWLKAGNSESFFFSSKVVRIRPGAPTRGRIPFDYYAAEDLGNGVLKAPKISSKRAAEIYVR